jgi:hypothetical protein
MKRDTAIRWSGVAMAAATAVASTRCGSSPAASTFGSAAPSATASASASGGSAEPGAIISRPMPAGPVSCQIFRAIAWITGLALVTMVLAPAAALSDGDPASDELIGANVFYPFSPAVDARLEKELNAETTAAGLVHFPIKVALIDSPADLGAIPSLFTKPQQHADFLDQEISFAGTKQPLLVVMPNGYGVRGLNDRAAEAAAKLKPPAGSRSDDLARAAIVAVSKLAEAAGHRISGAPGGSEADDRGGPSQFAVGAIVLLAIAASAGVVWLRRRV